MDANFALVSLWLIAAGNSSQARAPMKKSIGKTIVVTILVAASSVYAQNIRQRSLSRETETALAALPAAEVAAATADNRPTTLSGNLGQLDSTKLSQLKGSIPAEFEKIAATFGVARENLKLHRFSQDKLGSTHADYELQLNGLPVIGTRLQIHVDSKGKIYFASGIGLDLKSAAKSPAITTDSAKSAATAATAARQSKDAIIETPDLVYLVRSRDQKLYLAYRVRITGTSTRNGTFADDLFIDAAKGEPIDRHPLINDSKDRIVRDANHVFTVPSTSVRTEGSSATGNSTYDTNYNYLGIVYDYYQNYFGRDSLDNLGLTLDSVVNVAAPGGGGLSNAFWDGHIKKMAFGDGNPVTENNWVVSFDITAHELTHGVTQFSSSLIYANESGAINESMSDIMAASADSHRGTTTGLWQCGEDIALSGAPIRYMDTPQSTSCIDYYPEIYTISLSTVPDSLNNDNGYVHYNSGISNLAYYLIVNGGQHPRQGTYSSYAGGYIPSTSISGIGIADAEQIFHRANTVYMGPGTQFMDFRQATIQSAIDLHGSGSPQATNVALAWDVVGVPTFTNRFPINISSRAQVGTGADVMIAGFALSGGSTPKTLLIRGIGPTLSTYGVSGVLANPELTINNGGTQIDYNDDWSSSGNATTIASTASSVGAFALPNPSYDASTLTTVSANNYTAKVSGVSGGTGIGLVEVYDTDPSNPLHLINISTRAQVGTGANVVVAGFYVYGSGNKTLLIRGIGPALAAYGVSGYLTDPQLVLKDGGGNTLRSNNNWETDENNHDVSLGVSAAAARVGAFSLAHAAADSALLVSLPAGAYSVTLSGVSGGTGVGLIEVYEVN